MDGMRQRHQPTHISHLQINPLNPHQSPRNPFIPALRHAPQRIHPENPHQDAHPRLVPTPRRITQQRLRAHKTHINIQLPRRKQQPDNLRVSVDNSPHERRHEPASPRLDLRPRIVKENLDELRVSVPRRDPQWLLH
ncbi:hypothetical protein ASPCAL00926 [Aspergillus calidoustus]|uniref:Uncharacterized protein n=1 Tax=Aspergillus calidoustus TaxID=454130 RepID=A0A0U5FRV9_ASPCI|nr:hypothetical protein ASPCAL00926 [Aspergillus calidoustus]